VLTQGLYTYNVLRVFGVNAGTIYVLWILAYVSGKYSYFEYWRLCWEKIRNLDIGVCVGTIYLLPMVVFVLELDTYFEYWRLHVGTIHLL
jgi:hypothetical protein